MIETESPKRTPFRIVCVADGQPDDPRTASGVASHLFQAMRGEGYFAGAISSKPQPLGDLVAKARSFAPTFSAWRSRYRLSMDLVNAAEREARENLRRLERQHYDAIFQIGAYCHIASVVKAPIFSYHDNDVLSMVTDDPRMLGTRLDAAYVKRRVDVEARYFRATRRVFTYSDWCKRRICENFDVPEDKVEVVGAGSNVSERLLTGDRDYAAQHVLFVGLDFERKGGPNVLRAFAKVRRKLPNARLTFVGRVGAGPLAPGVTSFGVCRGEEALAELLRSASLFVMPSVWEPFGIVFLEAMAAGIPCIGSDRCAMPEIIGDSGIVVPPNDSDALARAMIELLADPAAAAARGRAARNRYNQRYGWDSVARRIGASIDATLRDDSERGRLQ